MTDSTLESIAAPRREHVRTALEAAFGSAAISALQPLRGGASDASVYRLDHGGRTYVLRLDRAPGEHGNPQRSYACMRIAADAKLAPALHWADPATGVAIMDFVAARPLSEYPHGPQGLMRELGSLVARLQATPTFPPVADFSLIVAHLLAQLRSGGLFRAGLLDAHHEGFERIRARYPWHEAGALSNHNDLNPTNVLFDGSRLWLIDWQVAFRNDPLADIANVAVNFDATPELADVLLTSWLGRAPDRELRARLVVMRQVRRLYYACITLSDSIGRVPQETTLDALTREELLAAAAAGTWIPGAPGSMHVLGKSYLGAFLRELHTPQFEAALAAVSGT